MKIKKYKFQEGDVLPDDTSSTPTTEKSITEKVNEFNNKWFNSKRQNIGLNSFYNQTVDEENERDSLDKERIPYVKAPSGNIKQTGEFVSAPGDDRLITQNIWYSSKPLSDAKEKLSRFNANVPNTNIKQISLSNTGAIGSYKRRDGNTIEVERSLNPKDKFSTAIHESAHRLTGWDQTEEPLWRNKFLYDYFLVDDPEDSDSYIGTKNEKYARVHQGREALNLDPDIIYSENEIIDKINKFEPASIHQQTTLVDNLFNRYSSRDLTNMFNNSFKNGGIIKAEIGTSLNPVTDSYPLPKLTPLTTKASTLSASDIIRPQDTNRHYLNIYENAKKEGRLFEGNEGDRFGMRFLGERPSGFNIDDYTAKDITKRPVLSKKLGVTNSSTNEDIEKALYSASDPNSDNYDSYLKLNKKLDIVKNNGIPTPSMKGRVEVGKRIEEAQKASDFLDQRYKSRGMSGLAKNIMFSDYDSLIDSGRSLDGEIRIGISPENKVKYGRRYLTTVGGTVTHEGGHGDPIYNTNMNDTDDVYSDKQIKQIFKDSPAYGNIYSNVPDEEQKLLAYKWWKFPNKHNRELSEGYSDLLETQQNMRELGISDAAATGGIYTEDDVRKYLNTDLGRGDRFVRLRGGRRGRWFNKMINALNTVGLD